VLPCLAALICANWFSSATALFTCLYPAADRNLEPEMRAFNFGKPVIDFYVGEDGRVWVSLDKNWCGDNGIGVEKRKELRLREDKSVTVLELCGGEARVMFLIFVYPVSDTFWCGALSLWNLTRRQLYFRR
jgi:hypothetical protein